ncbi:hypothetical protein [Fulvimarina sp. MAC3]|uniref:hypothetical protein n=1 Tax=Fulvimarina sp. MAC3 TaxID=3148887 RepID=UPI0031FC1900
MDHEPKYTISQIGEATGYAPNTIRTQFQRGFLKFMETDKRAGGNGLAHFLSMQSALYIATFGALVAQGMSPRIAGDAAVQWVHIGSNDPFGKLPERAPGALFEGPGFTLLCVAANGEAEVKFAPLKGGSVLDLLASSQGRLTGVTIIVLNDIDRQVRSKLTPSAFSI